MGRGGEKAASRNVALEKQKIAKLEKLETTELRKWAKAYAVKGDAESDRETLLKALVCPDDIVDVTCESKTIKNLFFPLVRTHKHTHKGMLRG